MWTCVKCSTFSSSPRWTSFGNLLDKAFKLVLSIFVYIYRSFFGYWFGGSCRFEPTCSQYALEALQKHNTRVSLKLIVNRLLRCRPGCDHGYDPVPDKVESKKCSKKTKVF